MFLDADGCRPEDERAAYGLPQVWTDDDGTRQRVDQVENVRFILSRYGDPAWTVERIAEQLVLRRFSTDRLRAVRGSTAACYEDPSEARISIETVIDNLDTYETGILTRRLGAGVEDLRITGCMPLGHPWAAPADFNRIRQYRDNRDERLGKAARATFAGTRATYNGVEVGMMSRRGRSSDQEPQYCFVREDLYPAQQRVPHDHVRVPAARWAESIVSGFEAAGRTTLELLDAALVDFEVDSIVATAQARVDTKQVELRSKRQEQQTIETQLGMCDHLGAPVLHGRLLERATARYDALTDTEIPELELEIRSMVAEIEEIHEKRPAAADLGASLLLVESLRRLEDRTYRGLWLTSLHNVEFTSEQAQGRPQRTSRMDRLREAIGECWGRVDPVCWRVRTRLRTAP
jgi:hypothetical protein